MTILGLGNHQAAINVYVETAPNIPNLTDQENCRWIRKNEIHAIGQQAGNGWRKVFNVYAKVVYELATKETCRYSSWQHYRDEQLLQQGSSFCLWLAVNSNEFQNKLSHHSGLNIVMGKGYATRLNIAKQCFWLSEDFAIHQQKQLIICPYFDYRQLTNQKITYLCQLITQSFPSFISH
ncbi:DUF6942 family protein [Thalassotalea sediminis]|uniref:DUF6942 family protein n=1 Tax=Thalassotalea sediminis TaxID=1759089 RepID=UPI003D9B5A34